MTTSTCRTIVFLNRHSRRTPGCQRRLNRNGTAAVEFALMLPLLMFIFAVGTDWCRIYYVAQTLDECARSGALAGSGLAYQERNMSDSQRESRAKVEATKDAGMLAPALKASDVTLSTSGNFVTVTVSYPFNTLMTVPIVGGTWNLTRSVRMPIQP